MSLKRKRGETNSHNPAGSSSWRASVFWPPHSPSARTWIRGKPRPSGSLPPPPPRQCQPQNGPFPSCDLRDDLKPWSESSEGGSRRFPAAHREDYCGVGRADFNNEEKSHFWGSPCSDFLSSPLLYISTPSTAEEGTKNGRDRTILIIIKLIKL